MANPKEAVDIVPSCREHTCRPTETSDGHILVCGSKMMSINAALVAESIIHQAQLSLGRPGEGTP